MLSVPKTNLLALYFPFQKVIEVSKKYLPMTAVGFSDPRVKVHIQDGNVFLEDNKGKFDVIITDSSDSSGEPLNYFCTS